jgi:hypothetical protein
MKYSHVQQESKESIYNAVLIKHPETKFGWWCSVMATQSTNDKTKKKEKTTNT